MISHIENIDNIVFQIGLKIDSSNLSEINSTGPQIHKKHSIISLGEKCQLRVYFLLQVFTATLQLSLGQNNQNTNNS
jgi:hypothetical protein